jgi:hypothetical protein
MLDVDRLTRRIMATVMSLKGLHLAVGDPRRAPIGRAVGLTLVASALFVAFAVGVKDIPSFGEHAPWNEDPYDAVFSFAIFFVPLIVALLALRLALCRRTEPLPIARVIDVIRGCRLALGIVTVGVAAGWVSVMTSIDALGSTTSRFLIAGLGLETSVAAVALAALWMSTNGPASIGPRPSSGPDWLTDASILAGRLAPRLGGEGTFARREATTIGRTLVVAIRRFPFSAAFVAALLFGIFVGLAATLEGDPPILILLLGAVGTGGMLAFFVTAGAYLGLVRRDSQGIHLPGPLGRAALAAATSLPLAVAFRDSLWWVVGSDVASGRLDQLAELLAVVAIATVGLVLSGQALIARRAPRT